MNWREGLRRGRSHVIFVIVLAVAGTTVVRIENDTLEAETGTRPAPRSDVPTLAVPAASLPHAALPRSSSPGSATKGTGVPAPLAPGAPLRPDVVPAATTLPARTPTPPQAPDNTVLVQAGAYDTRDEARRAGERMLRDLDGITDVSLRVVPYRDLFRVRFTAGDRAAAQAICDRLAQRNQSCWIIAR